MSEPMAPEPAAGREKQTTTSAASPPIDKRRAAVEALMRLASDRPWSDIEIGDVAREAGLSLSEMRDLFPSKGAMLEGFTRMIDKIVIDGTTEDLLGEPARERIFDVVMRRFDALAPYKPALRRIVFAMRGEVAALPALNRMALNSARYMLAAAGVPTEGPLGTVKLQGFVLALANVSEAWFDDDDPTLAKTMARLDRELGRGERLLERAEDVRRLTAPLRAFGQALMDGRDRMRRRAGTRSEDRTEAEDRDPAAAI